MFIIQFPQPLSSDLVHHSPLTYKCRVLYFVLTCYSKTPDGVSHKGKWKFGLKNNQETGRQRFTTKRTSECEKLQTIKKKTIKSRGFVKDPLCAKFTLYEKLFSLPIYIGITSEPIVQFQHCLAFDKLPGEA